MKKLAAILVLLMASVCSFAQVNASTMPTPSPSSNNYTRPDAGERFKKYVKGTVGPTALIGPFVSASWKQIRNRPEEWGRNPRGFGKRFADSFGRSLISNTVTYGLDEALRLDSSFYRSTKRDFKSKLSNAFLSAVTARNREGKRVIGIPKLVGTYSAAIIANETWMPDRFNYKRGLRDGTISIGTRVIFNLIREMF